MTQPPNGRPDFEMTGRPDFTPSAPPIPTPQAPPPQGSYAPWQAPGGTPYLQPSMPPAAGGKGKGPLLLGLVGILVVALLVLGWAFLFGPLAGKAPGSNPSEPAAVTGKGKLPETPKIKAPAIIDEVAADAGLTCHDEATTGIKVRGCYLQEQDRYLTLRFLITDGGDIESVFAVVHDTTAAADARAEELASIISPLLPTLPLTDGDRAAVTDAITGSVAEVDGRTTWGSEEGSFNFAFMESTTSLSLGRYSTTVMAPIPLSTQPDAVLAVLEERGWTCEQDDSSYDCIGQGIGNIVLSVSEFEPGEKELRSFQVWFSGRPPAPEEPLMIDAYFALAAAGEKGEAMGIGLRQLAEGQTHFFNSDAEFYRGDSYYEIKGVAFN